MSAPPALQIREANAHLAALHGRLAELERRLGAAEGTVRGQAQSLIRKDAELRAALEELQAAKDRYWGRDGPSPARGPSPAAGPGPGASGVSRGRPRGGPGRRGAGLEGRSPRPRRRRC